MKYIIGTILLAAVLSFSASGAETLEMRNESAKIEKMISGKVVADALTMMRKAGYKASLVAGDTTAIGGRNAPGQVAMTLVIETKVAVPGQKMKYRVNFDVKAGHVGQKK